MKATPLYASTPQDPLSTRLGELRELREQGNWAELLLRMGQELTVAVAGGVISGEPLQLVVPQGATCPDEWIGVAARAIQARGVWAGPTGSRWLFGVPVGHVGPTDAAPAPAALVLEIATLQQLDLALTRERLATLGAFAETITQASVGRKAVSGALAAASADGMLRASDQMTGLLEAANVLARRIAGIERLALVRIARKSAATLVIADQPVLDRAADLPRMLAALAEETLDLTSSTTILDTDPPSPAQQTFFTRFGRRPLLIQVSPFRRLVLVVTFHGQRPADAETAFAPSLALLERVLDPRPPRVRQETRNLWMVRLSGVAALVALLALLPRGDVVEAPATFQPEWQQVISAPFDGVIDASTVQPGDNVEGEKTILARLQTREIELEIAAARANAANERRNATVARAGGQPAQEQIALLSAQRAEARVALLEHRLSVAELHSPVSGVIVSGDLRRSLGQPVVRGQTLFEIAPDAAKRLEIRVLDEDINRVSVGQSVLVMPAAEPERPRRAVVERVRPAAEVVQQRNSFLVVARLDLDASPLRPGSEGVARIETGTTTWLWSLLRQPVRYIRQIFWI